MKNVPLVLILFASATAFAEGPAPDKDAAPTTTATATDSIKSPIANFHTVSVDAQNNDRAVIYRGANPIDKWWTNNIPELAKLGVKTDIDLQGGDGEAQVKHFSGLFHWLVKEVEPGEKPAEIAAEEQKCKNSGLQFLSFPLNSLQPVTDDVLTNTIPKILETMHNPDNWPVYVHCEHGHDRTGLIIALYRVMYEHMPVAKAYQEMLDMGHNNDDHVTQSMDIAFFKLTRGYP